MTYCTALEATLSINSFLDKDTLMSLFSGDILFLSVESFKHYPDFDSIIKRVAGYEMSSYSYDGSTVSHLGVSSYEIDENPSQLEKYYDTAEENIQRLREVFWPELDPILLFKNMLVSIWEPGVNYIDLHGKKTFAGIIRSIHKGSRIHAHQDLLAWSNPFAKNAHDLQGQFGMNFFIQVPKRGGHLMMWKESLGKEEFYEASKGDFCIHLDNMRKPDIYFQPKQGMLTLLNSRYLHAIEAPEDQDRIAVSCFLGYLGKDKPLLIWS